MDPFLTWVSRTRMWPEYEHVIGLSARKLLMRLGNICPYSFIFASCNFIVKHRKTWIQLSPNWPSCMNQALAPWRSLTTSEVSTSNVSSSVSKLPCPPCDNKIHSSYEQNPITLSIKREKRSGFPEEYGLSSDRSLSFNVSSSVL